MQRVAHAGENADFWHVSKFNTGSLPLRGILPVKIGEKDIQHMSEFRYLKRRINNHMSDDDDMVTLTVKSETYGENALPACRIDRGPLSCQYFTRNSVIVDKLRDAFVQYCM